MISVNRREFEKGSAALGLPHSTNPEPLWFGHPVSKWESGNPKLSIKSERTHVCLV
jgi:hypothetical protein